MVQIRLFTIKKTKTKMKVTNITIEIQFTPEQVDVYRKNTSDWVDMFYTNWTNDLSENDQNLIDEKFLPIDKQGQMIMQFELNVSKYTAFSAACKKFVLKIHNQFTKMIEEVTKTVAENAKQQ